MGEITNETIWEIQKDCIKIHENHDQQIKSLKHRVSAVEDMTKELQEMNISLKLMVEKMDAHQDELTEQKTRIQKLEAVPASRWNSIVQTIITALVGGAVAMLLERLL